jgi:hypothetical protein
VATRAAAHCEARRRQLWGGAARMAAGTRSTATPRAPPRANATNPASAPTTAHLTIDPDDAAHVAASRTPTTSGTATLSDMIEAAAATSTGETAASAAAMRPTAGPR